MCLDVLSTKNKRKLPRSLVCYKLFTNRGSGHGRYLGGWCFNKDTHYKTSRLYRDRSEIPLEAWNSLYPCGFHAYSTLKEARQRGFRNDDVIKRVRLSRIVAKGKQDGCRVYVGRTMKILRGRVK